MGLTIGRAPFGRQRSGQFNFELAAPEAVLYIEDSPRRVRVVFNGTEVANSGRVKLLHESGRVPVYLFPEADVNRTLLRPSARRAAAPHKGEAAYWSVAVGDRVAEDAAWSYPEPVPSARFLAGHFGFEWDRMDAWFEEDEQVFGHPRDPYHRVDVRDSSRHVRVVIDGAVVADTRRPRLLFETGLPTRYYLPPEDVRADLLQPSERHTRCPYKGVASYYSVRTPRGLAEDVVWYYPDPLPESAKIKGLLAFYNERVELEVDA